MSSFSDLKPNEDPVAYVGRMQAEKEAMRVRAEEARVRASGRGSDASTGKKTEKGVNGKEANGEEEERRRDTRFYTFYDELLEEWTYR
jgi:sirohydrochlorin ferrochelatase